MSSKKSKSKYKSKFHSFSSPPDTSKSLSRMITRGETVGAIGVRRSPRLSPAVQAESAAAGSLESIKSKRKGPAVGFSSAGRSESQSHSAKNRGSEVQSSTSNGGNKEATGTRLESMKVVCLRRSPRLSSNGSSKYTLGSPIKGCGRSVSLELIAGQLSRSWRVNADEDSASAKFSGQKQVRRSPRFSADTQNGRNNGTLKRFEITYMSLSIENRSGKSPNSTPCNEIVVHKEYLSRCNSQSITSPGLAQAIENGGSNESVGKYGVEKQLRRSPKFLSSLDGPENSEVNSTPCILPNLSDEQPSKKLRLLSGDFDLKTSGKKCLRESSKTEHKSAINYDRSTSSSKVPTSDEKQSPKNIKAVAFSQKKQKKHRNVSSFVGDPIPNDVAQERWRWRYEMKHQKSKRTRLPLLDDDEDKIVSDVECHYAQAEIGGCIFDLGDCAYIRGEGAQKHVGRILEFFKATDGEKYFRVQWFYRAEDTVIQEAASFHDKRRLFYSTVMNDNPIDCIISKVNVTHISPRIGLRSNFIPESDLYFDMEYCMDYSTFRTLPEYYSFKNDYSLYLNNDTSITSRATSLAIMPSCETETSKAVFTLLDLYSGCGGMSTGLCLGAKASRIDLVTKWAIDSDKSACESLELNHPATHVRNEAAEDFLELLKKWSKLCKQYVVHHVERTKQSRSMASEVDKRSESSPNDADIAPGEYEVESLVDICYGDPCKTGKRGLKFKVHWKGYSASEDTWEPFEGLRNCQEVIRDFVTNGFRSKILPLPGDVDVICGGPPCQGISGYNRYRNVDSPLDDERNRQIVVFMNIVEYLKPKYVLMENVVDILRFDKASLGRYALSRLVHMKYQARLGIIAAGCYGLPQFRLRVFLWGALPTEKLPQFPLPTHDVVVRYWPPPEFERNTVAYDEGQPRKLEDALVLQDAISDLPPVTNNESREQRLYKKPPETEFQRYIRSRKCEFTGSTLNGATSIKKLLYDHRPATLFEDDYMRVCLIPKKKGANFRDLPGIIVGKDNVVRRDPSQEPKLLPSGKPLVPDYVFTFEQGKSKRPFARLWWDETVPTVLTAATCHNQAALHPEQDRVLTIREYARLQGFPDCYRFCGTVKERYCQVGNAVAVPVARALGYAMGMAFRKLSGNEPLMILPPKFSLSTNAELAK